MPLVQKYLDDLSPADIKALVGAPPFMHTRGGCHCPDDAPDVWYDGNWEGMSRRCLDNYMHGHTVLHKRMVALARLMEGKRIKSRRENVDEALQRLTWWVEGKDMFGRPKEQDKE